MTLGRVIKLAVGLLEIGAAISELDNDRLPRATHRQADSFGFRHQATPDLCWAAVRLQVWA